MAVNCKELNERTITSGSVQGEDGVIMDSDALLISSILSGAFWLTLIDDAGQLAVITGQSVTSSVIYSIFPAEMVLCKWPDPC